MELDTNNEYNAKYLAMLPQWKCHKVVQAGKITFMAKDEPNQLLMVHAEPSNMPFAVPLDFLHRHNPERGGYFVVYEDGYISYSPADVFEAGYHELPPLGTACGGTADEAPAKVAGTIDPHFAPTGLDFSMALNWLKTGKRLQRAGWNGAGQWVEMATGDGLFFSSPHLDVSMPVALHLVLKNAQDVFVPGWTPSTGDLMADDWQVVR